MTLQIRGGPVEIIDFTTIGTFDKVPVMASMMQVSMFIIWFDNFIFTEQTQEKLYYNWKV